GARRPESARFAPCALRFAPKRVTIEASDGCGSGGAMSREAGAAEGRKVVVASRKARHEYNIEDTVEAGLVLTGTEIKSVRAGRVSLADSYARVENGEAWLYNLHISPYEQGNRFNVDSVRKRKLLLHRREIDRLI